MKKDIHPGYHQKTEVHCACGNKFYIGSTKERIEIEICPKCHPFFTGQERLIDTAGRVKKFEARLEKTKAIKTKKAPKKKLKA